MALIDQITADLNEALKAKDEVKVSTLRFLLSGIHNAKIAKRDELTDQETAAEIAKEAKRHRESIESYQKAQRSDLANKEKAELSIIQVYLPEQLSQTEIAKIVDDVILKLGPLAPSDFGKVMSQVMLQVKGQAEGNLIAQIVRDKLSQ